MYFAKTTCGDEAEMMLEEILKCGYETASQVIVKTFQRLQQFPREFQVPKCSNNKLL